MKFALVIGFHIMLTAPNGASVEESSTMTFRHHDSIESCEQAAGRTYASLEFSNRMRAQQHGLTVRELKITHHCVEAGEAL